MRTCESRIETVDTLHSRTSLISLDPDFSFLELEFSSMAHEDNNLKKNEKDLPVDNILTHLPDAPDTEETELCGSVKDDTIDQTLEIIVPVPPNESTQVTEIVVKAPSNDIQVEEFAAQVPINEPIQVSEIVDLVQPNKPVHVMEKSQPPKKKEYRTVEVQTDPYESECSDDEDEDDDDGESDDESSQSNDSGDDKDSKNPIKCQVTLVVEEDEQMHEVKETQVSHEVPDRADTDDSLQINEDTESLNKDFDTKTSCSGPIIHNDILSHKDIDTDRSSLINDDISSNKEICPERSVSPSVVDEDVLSTKDMNPQRPSSPSTFKEALPSLRGNETDTSTSPRINQEAVSSHKGNKTDTSSGLRIIQEALLSHQGNETDTSSRSQVIDKDVSSNDVLPKEQCSCASACETTVPCEDMLKQSSNSNVNSPVKTDCLDDQVEKDFDEHKMKVQPREGSCDNGSNEISVDNWRQSQCETAMFCSTKTSDGDTSGYGELLYADMEEVESFEYDSGNSDPEQLGIESPMSMNSSTEMNCSSSVERTPSQTFSDCAQMQNIYSASIHTGATASSDCGYINNLQLHMNSPAGQLMSPASNQSFQMAGQSPGMMSNGGSYGSNMADYVAVSQSPTAAVTGKTFKMPTRSSGDSYCSNMASMSPYAGGGNFNMAVTSPGTGGGYVAMYMDQSPGSGFTQINHNSPTNNNCIGYGAMPTPSPTNSSSRSFNMASPNAASGYGSQIQTPAQQQLPPSVAQMYDRSCPSAPVITYSRVLPQHQQQMDPRSLPWQHFYHAQAAAAGCPIIKFPEISGHGGDFLPQNAMAAVGPPSPVECVTQPQHHYHHQPERNLTPMSLPPATKAAKCCTAAAAGNKQHRRCGKSCKSGLGGSSTLRGQTVAPNVTIQPGTNMITSYNVLNMNVTDYHHHPYPSSYIINHAAAQQMHINNIYQQHQAAYPQQPHHQMHNSVYAAAAATYGYGAALAQQPFNVMRQ